MQLPSPTSPHHTGIQTPAVTTDGSLDTVYNKRKATSLFERSRKKYFQWFDMFSPTCSLSLVKIHHTRDWCGLNWRCYRVSLNVIFHISVAGFMEIISITAITATAANFVRSFHCCLHNGDLFENITFIKSSQILSQFATLFCQIFVVFRNMFEDETKCAPGL